MKTRRVIAKQEAFCSLDNSESAACKPSNGQVRRQQAGRTHDMARGNDFDEEPAHVTAAPEYSIDPEIRDSSLR
jgi:hypothetical protein